jgi:type I restriction enzyme S subunit
VGERVMEYIALKEVCSINMGQSPDSSTYNNEANGLPFFQGNADFGERYPVTRVWCSAPSKIACTGDILISVRAPIGATNYAKEKCCIGRGLAAITPDLGKVSSEFIFWLLKAKNDELNKKGTGSTFKAISRKVLEETLVPNIGLEEQLLFSKILEKNYSIVQDRKQQLQKLDELVKARFVEMFGRGDCPKVSVESVCTEIVDCPHTTPKYEGELVNPAIRTAEIKKGYIDWETMRYVSDDEYIERTARLIPEAGDIVYGREGTIGNAAVLPKGYKFCLGQRVMLLRPDYKKCTSEYLLHAIISDDVSLQARAKNNASTVAHVNVKDVKQFFVPLPELDKQKQFAAFVEQVDKSKAVVQKALDEAQLLFDSLMQEYFG